jgi:hypothetical protein
MFFAKHPKTAKDFTSRADACTRLAGTALRPETRNTMLDLAARWRLLAAEAEARQHQPRERERLRQKATTQTSEL